MIGILDVIIVNIIKYIPVYVIAINLYQCTTTLITMNETSTKPYIL